MHAYKLSRGESHGNDSVRRSRQIRRYNNSPPYVMNGQYGSCSIGLTQGSERDSNTLLHSLISNGVDMHGNLFEMPFPQTTWW